MRGISNKNILDEFTIEFADLVQKHCNYIVVSGFVAISSGRTRATENIDMIIERLDKKTFSQLHKDLVNNKFICVQSDTTETIYEYLQNNDSIRYTKKGKPLPEMELKFAKDQLDYYQFQTKTKLELTGLDLWFSSIEVNIAFKEELLKSEKDLKDAEHLRKVYEPKENEIHKVKKMIRRYRL